MSGVFDYEHRRGRFDYAPSVEADQTAFPSAELDIGGTTYWSLDLLGRKRWLKQNLTSANGNVPGGTSPDRLLAVLVDSSKRIERFSTDEIRGVRARQYRARLDNAKALEYGWLGQLDAWIDADGLVRRLEMPVGAELSVTVDFFDFGVPVDIQTPPAREIVRSKQFDGLATADCRNRRRTGESLDVWWCSQ